MYPFLMKPVYDQRLWGANHVPELRGDDAQGVGVSWEVSVHEGCNSTISNGEYAGKTLAEVMEANPKEVMGNARSEQLVRCAYSDPCKVLSIQDHPTDEYAYAHDGECGKTESWYVIHAEPGAALIAGANTQDKGKIEEDIKDHTLEYDLNYRPVKDGDFVHIQQGEIHALGPNIMILEIAGNSDLTYRLYDFARKDKDGNYRELHLEKGLEILNLSLQSEVTHTPLDQKVDQKVLVATDKYMVEVTDVNGEKEFANDGSYSTLHVVSGSGSLEYNGQAYELPFLQSVFIPAACESFVVKGTCRVVRGVPVKK